MADIQDEDHDGRGFGCYDPEGYLWSVGGYDPWVPEPGSLDDCRPHLFLGGADDHSWIWTLPTRAPQLSDFMVLALPLTSRTKHPIDAAIATTS